MKKFNFFLFLTIISLMVISCDIYKWNFVHANEIEICDYCINNYVDSTVKTDTIISIITDTIQAPFWDSLLSIWYFECDSNNQVLLSKIDNLSESSIQQKYLFNKGVLKLSVYLDSIKIYREKIKILESSISTTIIEKPVPVQKIIKVIPWCIWCIIGVLSFLILILVIRIIFKK